MYSTARSARDSAYCCVRNPPRPRWISEPKGMSTWMSLGQSQTEDADCFLLHIKVTQGRGKHGRESLDQLEVGFKRRVRLELDECCHQRQPCKLLALGLRGKNLCARCDKVAAKPLR